MFFQQSNPGDKKYHNKSFPGFKKLASIVEGNQATGEWAISDLPLNTRIQPEFDDNSVDMTDSNSPESETPNSNSPNTQATLSSRKRRPTLADIQERLDKLMESLQTSSENVVTAANSLQKQTTSIVSQATTWVQTIDCPNWSKERRILAISALTKNVHFCEALMTVFEEDRLCLLGELVLQ